MPDNPAIAAALGNPAKPDGPSVEMAVVQVTERPARTHTDKDGNVTVTRPAVLVGLVHHVVMVPPITSLEPPADTALIPAAGLRAGAIAEPAQLAPVLGAAQGVKLEPRPMPVQRGSIVP